MHTEPFSADQASIHRCCSLSACVLSLFSCVGLFMTLWTVVRLLCHGILQARILEWVVMPLSRDLPDPGIKPWSLALQADCLH